MNNVYCTTDTFQQKVGVAETIQITNLDDPSATEVNLIRLMDALVDASREIDSYISTRYSVPLDPTRIPGVLRIYCVDITWYRLAQNNASEQFSDRYKNAIARLKDIQKGIMLMLDDNGVPIPPRDTNTQLLDERGNPVDDSSVSYQPGGEGRIFTREFLNLQDAY